MPKKLIILKDAIERYSYPAVTYDFINCYEIKYCSVNELIDDVNPLLMSSNLDDQKEGLKRIIYWGNLNDNRFKCSNFETIDINYTKINYFAGVKNLNDLKKLKIPYFGQTSFGSKLLTFINRREFVILDSKINKFLLFNCNFKEFKNFNSTYQKWLDICTLLANDINNTIHCKPYYPVDVERGIFQLIKENICDGKCSKSQDRLDAIITLINDKIQQLAKIQQS